VGQTTDRCVPFRKRLAAFAGELRGLHEGDIEAVHRARVASRRIREILPLLELDRETTRQLSRRLRNVTRRLGSVRELDVLTLLMAELQGCREYSTVALDTLRRAVSRDRAAARERLAAKLPMAKLERLTHRLEQAAAHLESDDAKGRSLRTRPKHAWLWALDARLGRRAASLLSTIEAAGSLYQCERLHDIRIALKKLRYTAELSTEAGRRQWRHEIETLKATQELLGRLHDLQVLLARGHEAQATFTPGDPTAVHMGSLVFAVEADCRQLHARYMRNRTTLVAITNRMRTGTLTEQLARPLVAAAFRR